MEELRNDPRFSTNLLRINNRDALNRLINQRISSDTQANWVKNLNAAGVPCGVVQNLPQALSDPQTLHREMVITVDHPGHGLIRTLGFPVKLSKTPCVVRHPAPEKGAHLPDVVIEWDVACSDDARTGVAEANIR
jgi:crotonobetainyl-CoA:carnitine CoA-transferase CaiB-like acyl-CoA transferase